MYWNVLKKNFLKTSWRVLNMSWRKHSLLSKSYVCNLIFRAVKVFPWTLSSLNNQRKNYDVIFMFASWLVDFNKSYYVTNKEILE